MIEQLATAGLASARLARLVSEDTLTAPARDRLVVTTMSPSPTTAAAADLALTAIECPWCVTVWSSAVVAVVARTRPGRTLVGILAIAELAGRTRVRQVGERTV